MIKGIKIDENGFFVTEVIVEADTVSKDIILIECPNGFYKPKWTGVKWIEGATNEEIEKENSSTIAKAGMDEFRLDVDYRLSKLELGV